MAGANMDGYKELTIVNGVGMFNGKDGMGGERNEAVRNDPLTETVNESLATGASMDGETGRKGKIVGRYE